MTEDEKMDKILTTLTELDKKLDVHIVSSEHAERIAIENSRILKGVDGSTGLVSQVQKNTEDIADAKRIISKIIAPLLYAIGAGILLLIIQGANLVNGG